MHYGVMQGFDSDSTFISDADHWESAGWTNEGKWDLRLLAARRRFPALLICRVVLVIVRWTGKIAYLLADGQPTQLARDGQWQNGMAGKRQHDFNWDRKHAVGDPGSERLVEKRCCCPRPSFPLLERMSRWAWRNK